MTWRRLRVLPLIEQLGADDDAFPCVRHSYVMVMCFSFGRCFWADGEPGVSIADIALLGKILMDPTTAHQSPVDKAEWNKTL